MTVQYRYKGMTCHSRPLPFMEACELAREYRERGYVMVGLVGACERGYGVKS